MLLYIYLTAQLQHSEIWIPFTGILGAGIHEPGAPSAASFRRSSPFQLQSRG
jgi:hypothetical protein